jgi:uncharacterized protein
MKVFPGIGIILVFLLVIVLVVIDQAFFGCVKFNEGEILIGDHKFKVAVADSEAEKVRGLIGCQKLPKNKGMLFTYNSLQNTIFWMRGMSIPVDIVWIANGIVVGVEKNVQPISEEISESTVVRYESPEPIDFVFEIKAGMAEQLDIVKGAAVIINLKDG